MQKTVMAVSHYSVRKYGCIKCKGGFKDLEFVIKIGNTRFYKCRLCFTHTEVISLEKGAMVSEIEVRVKQWPYIITPWRLKHPQAPKKGTKISQEL